MVLAAWANKISELVTESIATTAAHQIPEGILGEIKTVLRPLDSGFSDENLGRTSFEQLFNHDLGYVPFRAAYLPEEMRPNIISESTQRLVEGERHKVPPVLVHETIEAGLKSLEEAVHAFSGNYFQSWSEQPGLVFATRPLSASEVFGFTHVLSRTCEARYFDLSKWLMALRGYQISRELVACCDVADGNKTGDSKPGCHGPGSDGVDGDEPGCDKCHWVIELSNGYGYRSRNGRPRIAVTMLEIEESSWTASVHGNPDHSLDRYRRVSLLIEHIRRSREKPDYVILPELAIPSRWF